MAISPDRLAQLLQFTAPGLRLVARDGEDAPDYRIERLRFELDDGQTVRGILTRPPGPGRHPAILYAHAHGNAYGIGASELLSGRPALLSPLGPVFARQGFVTLAIDMPTFGERAGVGESALAKARLWYGRPLFGQMLSEQAAALSYLAGRDDVDAGRVGAFGISMGATLAGWLAALDRRISAVAQLCCFADFATLIETGAHDLHGIYLVVPGLLAETSTGAIAGLVAPRPQLVCVGADDPLTPPLAVERAADDARAGYGSGPFELVVQPGTGHRETEAMREAVLGFFARNLG